MSRKETGMKNLSWEEKTVIFEEVKHAYDVLDAKTWAENIGIDLTDKQAEEAANRFNKDYSSEFAAYDQMIDAIRAVVKAV